MEFAESNTAFPKLLRLRHQLCHQ